MKRPSFQFYPADWRKDPALSSCSLAARGLWIEMMCIAHECEPYGYVVVNGKAMTPAQLARQVGEQPKVVEACLAELEAAGVFSRDPEGRIYSRRMVRDERVRNARAAGGKLGGNPALMGRKDDGKDEPKVNLSPNHDANVGLTPSSSSSSSTSVTPPSPPSADAEGGTNGHDLLGSPRPTAREALSVPHETIVAAYHEILPMCPRVAAWSKKRRGLLNARWSEDKQRQSTDWWREFFGWVAQSKFLTGKCPPSPPRTVAFLANLQWLLTEEHFIKVIEGDYNRDAQQ